MIDDDDEILPGMTRPLRSQPLIATSHRVLWRKFEVPSRRRDLTSDFDLASSNVARRDEHLLRWSGTISQKSRQRFPARDFCMRVRENAQSISGARSRRRATHSRICRVRELRTLSSGFDLFAHRDRRHQHANDGSASCPAPSQPSNAENQKAPRTWSAAPLRLSSECVFRTSP
jgi:hypothetical protein